PTMFAATCWDLFKLVKDGGTAALTENAGSLIIGSSVAFVVAMLAIKWFVDFLAKYGFKAFGVYRIIIGGFILIWLLTGHSMIMFD
ncbi:MAG TPA: undecaprenyl-diphosphate phosphatase, partial [Xylanibacter oryzae]|nr:undecaprenyl-diphosphate phosphatase [Xylanibacter oryzae]